MPRVRSSDYDEKARAVVEAAAELFAQHGYPAVRMSQIADACGVSKSMIYYYYATKEDILFFIINEFLQELIDALEAYDGDDQREPADAIEDFVATFAARSTRSRQRNLVSTNDVKYLPDDKREAVLQLERKIIDQTARLVGTLRPDLSKDMYRPIAFILMGILTWTDRWYHPAGRMTQSELAQLISQVFLNGVNSLE